MKYILIAIISLAFLCPQTSFAQNKDINKFYRKYKKSDNATKISLPGWLISLGIDIGKAFVEDQEDKKALKFAKKIRKIKLLVLEDHNPVNKLDRVRMVNNLQNKWAYEPFIQVNDQGTQVNILVREKKDKLKNVFLLVHDTDEFVMISLRTKIKIKDINKLLQFLESEQDLPLDSIAPTPSDEEV